MRKNKIVSLIALLIASVTLCVGTVYAWFTIYDIMGGAELTIAKINSEITLFKGEDWNYDGNLDFEDVVIDGVTVKRPKYTQIGNTMQAKGEETAQVGASIMAIHDIMPSQKHTFKFHVVNKSDTRNEIRISFIGYDTAFWQEEGAPLYDGEDFDYFLQCLRVMSVTIKVLGDDGVTPLYPPEKIYLANAFDSAGFADLEGENRIFAENINLISGIILNASNGGGNELDIQLVFCFEPYENLVKPISQGGAGLIMTQEEYNAYSGEAFSKAFIFPLLRVYFEVPY